MLLPVLFVAICVCSVKAAVAGVPAVIPAVAVSAVAVPAVAVPPVAVPVVAVPPVAVPAVAVPPVAVPAVAVPPVAVPPVAVPAVAVPPVAVPAVAVPAVAVPPVAVPAVAVPVITVPAVAVSAVAVSAAAESKGADHLFFRRDYIFDENIRGWRKFHPIPLKWIDAALRCHNEGAMLASPLNKDFTKGLVIIMAEHGATSPIFTGISDTNAPSEFQSMEGVPISNIRSLKWSAQPDLSIAKEMCIALNADGTVTAVSCADRHPFVCYRRLGVKELNKCGTLDLEYVYSSVTRSCYRVHTHHRTWPDAFIRCAVDDAHLAIINSEAEAMFLFHYLHRFPGGTTFLGARAWGRHRDWITVQGQSLEDAGYARWRKDEPNNANGNEYCASMNNQPFGNYGVMNDVNCDDRYAFLCEIDTLFEADD